IKGCSHFVLLLFLLLLCITALERQVFDFLGYQWAPIMINFFHIIVVILGLFGVIQYRSRYVIMYLLWMLLWVGWNVFVSCLYLDLGGLSKDSDILSLGVSLHRSWWKDNGLRCGSEDLSSAGWKNQQNQQNPELTTVLSCWLEYQYIEVLHCIVQLLISVSLYYLSNLFSVARLKQLLNIHMFHQNKFLPKAILQ
uniref:Sodium/potassium-transporting ATPase subunit beta-1-interacting protein n=1 Tax=Sander lucioperca TaxID=283035 RepID=A0A8C9Z6H3_SANLU